MCKTARVALAALLAFVAPGSLTAQGAAGARVRERALDSLLAHWSRATATLKAYDDSVERTAIVLDTMHVGNLSMLIERSIRDRAERAGRAASARLDSIAGQAAKLASETWIVVRSASRSAQSDTVSVAVRFNNKRELSRLWGPASDSLLADWVYRASITALSMRIKGEMSAWLYNGFSPDSISTAQWLSTRLELVSAPASVAHRCYEGDVAACKTSLRLVPVGDVITEWYDVDSRRRFVADLARHTRASNPDADLCAEGIDKACIAVMRQVEHYADPIGPHRHGSVALTAIQIGGAGGYARLLSATGTPAERLEFAAGVPVDSVLRVWISSVRSAHRPSQDVSPGIAFTSIGWVLVCGMLALRSSRWR